MKHAPSRSLRSVFVFLTATLAASAGLAVTTSALACGVDETTFSRPVVQPVSSNADALFAEARRLDGRAATLEMRAGEMDRRAEAQAAEARELRLESIQAESESERARLQNLASTLATASIAERGEARRLREESSELRAEARVARERGNRLVGIRPPGWRGRPVVFPMRDHAMPPRPSTDV